MNLFYVDFSKEENLNSRFQTDDVSDRYFVSFISSMASDSSAKLWELKCNSGVEFIVN